MVFTCPPTSKSSSPFNNPLVTVPKEAVTIGIIDTFMFHSFLILKLGRGIYPFFYIIIIIIIIIIYSLELFTSALADGFSLESEWQQVSSSLQDSSQYSGRSQ